MFGRSSAAARRAGLGPLRHVAVTGSTNDDLVAEARNGLTSPCVLVADHQTAGKGRIGRRWVNAQPPTTSSRHGAQSHGAQGHGAQGQAAATGRLHEDPVGTLLVSFRFPGALQSASHLVNAVSLAALDAARAALAERNTGTSSDGAETPVVRFKWPNDLVVDCEGQTGKLAGVLTETVGGNHPVIVVGVGLNLAPVPDVQVPGAQGQNPQGPGVQGAASLWGLGAVASRDQVLADMLRALVGHRSDPEAARAALIAASATVGRRVRVEGVDGTSFTGRATAIDPQGRLVVETHTGTRTVHAADVHHLR